MRPIYQATMAIIGWFAVITQFILMMDNRVTPVGETLLRFFSFFTILTNILVAGYFTYQLLPGARHAGFLLNRAGFLTAMTTYIFMVGMVYQFALRHIWHPTGMQLVVDELLHTCIPALALIYWIRYADFAGLRWAFLPSFLIYPLGYLMYVLIRGAWSGFYPYYFIHVTDLGWPVVIRNILLLVCSFIVVSSGFIGIGRYIAARRTPI